MVDEGLEEREVKDVFVDAKDLELVERGENSDESLLTGRSGTTCFCLRPRVLELKLSGEEGSNET